MPIRLIDIARKTGYSVSTVSRVLHSSSKKYKISKEAEIKIRQAAKDLGYRPNKLAQSLKLKKTNEIGVIIPDISNPFFSALVKSIGKESRKNGYSIVLYESDENVSLEKEAIKRLLEKRVDGMIIAAVGLNEPYLKRLESNKLPVVTVDRCLEETTFDAISVDNLKGTYIAIQYLINEGHKKIAFIQGLPETFTNKGRLEGYLKALNNAQVPVYSDYIVGNDFRSLNGYLQTKKLLQLPDPPTVIFTAGDLIVLGALQAIKEEGLKIPDDISLVTFDDPDFATYLSPPLTSIRQPVDDMGILSVKLLLERMREPSCPAKRILLEPQLIIRNSVAKL